LWGGGTGLARWLSVNLTRLKYEGKVVASS
jgi:hypothetical protein